MQTLLNAFMTAFFRRSRDAIELHAHPADIHADPSTDEERIPNG
jgi:hypothetical protein